MPSDPRKVGPPQEQPVPGAPQVHPVQPAAQQPAPQAGQPIPQAQGVPPQGQVAPQGQAIQPHGQVAPQGQAILPQGQVVQPQGRPVVPQGQVAPQGQPLQPQAQPVQPQAQPGFPQVAPQGQQVAPQGQPVQPQGQPVHPHGQVTPQGQAVQPQGVPVGAHANQAVRPAQAAVAGGVPASHPAHTATTRKRLLARPGKEEEEEEEITDVAVKSAPPWLVSLVVHMVILIILALLTIPALARRTIDITVDYADEEGEQLLDDSFDMPSAENLEVETPLLSEDLVPVDDPFAAAPEMEITLDAPNATSDITAPSIGMALTGREKGMKKALLAAYGGTKGTEAAVADALKWLAKNQESTGTWSLIGPYTDGGHIENRAAATAMALLAFQGAGHTHKNGQYKAVVKKGIDALIKMQDADGNFYQSGPNHHRLYSQAQCTIAVCELYGMTKDSRIRDAAQKALKYCSRVQSPLGGWRYSPREDADTSVTGWFVMALQSGRMAGLEVNTTTLEKITEFLDSVQHDGGASYAYKPDEDSTITMTAEGLLCRQYLGWKVNDERLRRGVDEIALHPVDTSNENVYYWYYATQVMHHMGGEDWFKWNQVMREKLPASQVKAGPERGSWDPTNDDWGGRGGGRLFQTCLSVYNLEVYYRHLPIYKH